MLRKGDEGRIQITLRNKSGVGALKTGSGQDLIFFHLINTLSSSLRSLVLSREYGLSAGFYSEERAPQPETRPVASTCLPALCW